MVFIPETSDPASGSVKQKDASRGASPRRPKYSFLSSSEAPITIGAIASPLQDSDVPIPEQPQAISSSIRTPSKKLSPAPPYSSGRCVFRSPSSQAFSMIS